MYLAHMITLIEENIGNSWYMERAGELQQGIDVAIQNDPNKFFTYEETIDNLNNQVRQSVGISQLMDARNTYLQGTTYFQLSQPLISEITYDPQTIVPNSDVTVLARITNAGYAYLGYRATPDNEFEKIVKSFKVCVIPLTCGKGVINSFSDTVSGIISHLGFHSFAAQNSDAAGIAEAFEKESDIILLADDNRFVAINVHTKCVSDNNEMTA